MTSNPTYQLDSFEGWNHIKNAISNNDKLHNAGGVKTRTGGNSPPAKFFKMVQKFSTKNATFTKVKINRFEKIHGHNINFEHT